MTDRIESADLEAQNYPWMSFSVAALVRKLVWQPLADRASMMCQ